MDNVINLVERIFKGAAKEFIAETLKIDEEAQAGLSTISSEEYNQLSESVRKAYNHTAASIIKDQIILHPLFSNILVYRSGKRMLTDEYSDL